MDFTVILWTSLSLAWHHIEFCCRAGRGMGSRLSTVSEIAFADKNKHTMVCLNFLDNCLTKTIRLVHFVSGDRFYIFGINLR